MAPLVTRPVIIDEPGNYVTRCGEDVKIYSVSMQNKFVCRGIYPQGIHDGWHYSGRLYANIESQNDIVRKA